MKRIGARLFSLTMIVVVAACAGSQQPHLGGLPAGTAGPTPSPVPTAGPILSASTSPAPVPTAGPITPVPPTAKAVVNGRIAFTWTAPGSDVNNISSIAADGSDERVLTSSPTSMSEGVEWVPHGDRIAFDSDRTGCCFLFTMDSHGGDVRPVGHVGGGYPSIAPDGATIAIDGGPPQGIYVVNADGTNPRQVTVAPASPAVDSLPAFSPDGTRIAFERFLDATPGRARTAIFVVNVDGSGLTQLTDSAINASYPNWSPDGTHIVFNDNAENGSETVAQNVWVMNADGSHPIQLTHTHAGQDSAFGADWSPDGTKIVYVAVLRAHTLSVMNQDGSSPEIIWTAPLGQHIDDPDWGPDQ